MSRREYILSACEELKDIVRNQDDEKVEINEGEHRLGEISAKGTEDYPILVGAITANYINPSERPQHIDPTDNYSEERWERMVHRALMTVIQRLQKEKPEEDETDDNSNPSEKVDIPSEWENFAEAADEQKIDSEGGTDQAFVEAPDDKILEIFEESLESLIDNIKKSEYKIYFPLNIREAEEESFLVGGTKIQRVDNSKINQIFESNDINDISIGDNSLKDLVDLHDLHPTSYNQNWFWFCNVEAPSINEAISTVDDIIEIMIGKINYTIYYESNLLSENSLDQLLSSNLLDEEVIVERPPFIMIFEEENLVNSISRSDEFGNPVDLDDKFQTTYSELGFRKFPNSYARISEKTLASGLQGFFSAVSATNPRDSFFAYWRGLEDISFTDPEEDASADILKRTGDFCSIENVEALYHRLKQTRNSLVHSGGSPSITARDTILLREMFLDAFHDIREIEDTTMDLDPDTNMRYILKYIIDDSGIEHTRGTLDKNIKKSRRQIEEYNRQKNALSAVENWKDLQ